MKPGTIVHAALYRMAVLAGLALIGAAACSRSFHDISISPELFSFESEPSAEPTAGIMESMQPVQSEESVMRPVKITIAYNNVAQNPDLETDWGFSAYVEVGDEVVLFDTGTNGDILLRNMEKLGLDPTRVDTMVLSHLHNDHIGGSASVLGTGVRPSVYVLANFPQGYMTQLDEVAEMVVVEEPMKITEGVYITGPVSGAVTEQALILETTEGLVVITGCAHPGANRMTAAAMEVVEGSVYLVLGGFHLGGATESAVDAIITDFQSMGVQNVAPSHCTGGGAMYQFEQAYGEHYLSSGLGAVIEIH